MMYTLKDHIRNNIGRRYGLFLSGHDHNQWIYWIQKKKKRDYMIKTPSLIKNLQNQKEKREKKEILPLAWFFTMTSTIIFNKLKKKHTIRHLSQVSTIKKFLHFLLIMIPHFWPFSFRISFSWWWLRWRLVSGGWAWQRCR